MLLATLPTVGINLSASDFALLPCRTPYPLGRAITHRPPRGRDLYRRPGTYQYNITGIEIETTHVRKPMGIQLTSARSVWEGKILAAAAARALDRGARP